MAWHIGAAVGHLCLGTGAPGNGELVCDERIVVQSVPRAEGEALGWQKPVGGRRGGACSHMSDARAPPRASRGGETRMGNEETFTSETYRKETSTKSDSPSTIHSSLEVLLYFVF